MAKKYYVVWHGRETGIFTDWPTCKRQVDGFQGARYKSFATQGEAEQAFGQRFSRASSSSAQSLATKKPSTQTKKAKLKTYTQADLDALKRDIFIFTDGGCEPNPGEAGSGVALYRHGQASQLYYGLYNPMGTNNTAELNALHQALLIAQRELQTHASSDPITICCDSQYAIQCITQWAAGWEKKGWKKAGGEIKNLSLIQKTYRLYQSLKSGIDIVHVNGHVGVEGNELADRMSIYAIKTKQVDFIDFAKPINVAEILAMTNG